MNGSNSAEQLRSIVQRIENLNAEIDERNIDKSEIYKGAKHDGFDPAIIRKVVALRAKDPKKLAEQDELVETYMAQLGAPVALAGARARGAA